MFATAIQPQPTPPHDPDQFVVFHGVTWTEYEILLAIRGEESVPRMAYLEGELELMSPSQTHEGIKTTIARVLETYAVERRLHMNGYGSWTIRKAIRERGLEPDECYAFGRIPDERPDLAIEVVWTSGTIDKMEIYRGLEVPEVWVYEDRTIRIHALRDGEYAVVDRSAFLPDLDPTVVARFALYPDQSQAIFEFLDWLRGAD